MPKRTYTVRANFPTQQTDLVETVTGGSWPVALGMAARAMKKRMKGSRISAASFTLEQVKIAPEASQGQQTQPQLAEEQPETLDTILAPNVAEGEPHNNS